MDHQKPAAPRTIYQHNGRFISVLDICPFSTLGAASRISGDTLLELSVPSSPSLRTDAKTDSDSLISSWSKSRDFLGRLSVTDFVVFWHFLFAHTLLDPRVVSAVECPSGLRMDCVELRLPLPSPNDGVDVEWIKL
jgi:hypothetical protein